MLVNTKNSMRKFILKGLNKIIYHSKRIFVSIISLSVGIIVVGGGVVPQEAETLTPRTCQWALLHA